MRIRPQDTEHTFARCGLRAAIVLPTVFALTHFVWSSQQASVIASFGVIGILVFADFTGPAHWRLRAYVGLALTGSVLLPLGTLCSEHTALATVAMGIVAFGILFAGIVDGYVAAASSAALLLFVLPVMIPVGIGDIPDRIGGWALACAVSIPAALVLWPSRPQGPVHTAEAKACRALAVLLRAWADTPPTAAAVNPAQQAAVAAVVSVNAAFTATPYRPSGPSGPTAAMAQLVVDLEWLLPYAVPPGDGLPAGWDAQRALVHAAVADALEASALVIDGGPDRPDLSAVDAAHDAVGAAWLAWTAVAHDADTNRTLREAFRLRALSHAGWTAARHAMLIADREVPEAFDPGEPERHRDLQATRQELVANATMRSVWLRNSVRGAIALAGAVCIGHVLDTQHGYWIVLGTLAVLRSHALGTCSSVGEALLGTLAGICASGVLLLATGSNPVVLWTLLPFLAFLAAWAPKAISFLAGQAAFSLLVLVQFNIIDPVGWKLGILRVEDVAIGCAVSLLVSVLLWPRGAAAVVRGAMRASYDASVTYTTVAVAQLQRGANVTESRAAHRAALAAHDRLDTAFRQYLGERRAPTQYGLEAYAMLIGGAVLVRRTGHALVRTTALWTDALGTAPAPDHTPLDDELAALADWYRQLGAALDAGTTPPEPQARAPAMDPIAADTLQAGVTGDAAAAARTLIVAWASEHLETLRRHEPQLARAAERS